MLGHTVEVAARARTVAKVNCILLVCGEENGIMSLKEVVGSVDKKTSAF